MFSQEKIDCVGYTFIFYVTKNIPDFIRINNHISAPMLNDKFLDYFLFFRRSRRKDVGGKETQEMMTKSLI